MGIAQHHGEETISAAVNIASFVTGSHPLPDNMLYLCAHTFHDISNTKQIVGDVRVPCNTFAAEDIANGHILKTSAQLKNV